MKLDTLDHPKTYNLSAYLDCRIPETLGYLQLLWKFVGQHSTQGNIGKWENGAIARACLWEADPDKFIEGLIASGFLDDSEKHRLLVHDWEDHAPSWVRAKLKKLGLEFITESKQESLLIDSTEEATKEHSVEHSYRGEERSSKEKSGKERKKSDFSPPEKNEVIEYFLSNGYSEELAIRAFAGYHEADWHDSKGNKIKNWKQKMQHVWFKPENKKSNENSKQFGKSSGSKSNVERIFNSCADGI